MKMIMGLRSCYKTIYFVSKITLKSIRSTFGFSKSAFYFGENVTLISSCFGYKLVKKICTTSWSLSKESHLKYLDFSANNLVM